MSDPRRKDVGTSAQRLGEKIAERLSEEKARLSKAFSASGAIRHFVVDRLLGETDAETLSACFPSPEGMQLRNSFRERKYVSAQMDQHDPMIEAALFAFHEPGVVDVIRDIVGKADLFPDPELYAGGISQMGGGHFLNPHIDNSHDGERQRWRNLNLLYYVSPDWKPEDGGALELWAEGPKNNGLPIPAAFDRLIVMETHQHAWHSVSPISESTSGTRRCVSNYYFGDSPMRADQRFHVTAFRGRPEQPVRDLVARGDAALRMGIRKLVPGGIVKSKQRYKG